METVYLNGNFKPLAEASINVLDRGFTFGDGVYEVIPVFNRKVFRLDEHLDRLENSLKAIYMENPLNKNRWSSIFNQLIKNRAEKDQSIYLQITRGVTERNHDIELADSPTIFVMSRPILKKDMFLGIKAITHEDIRWQRCDIKAITLLSSVLIRHKAKEKGASEAILIRNGIVTEGAASNVFIVENNKVYTPLKDNHVLPGITRNLVSDLLSKNNFDFMEGTITVDQLLRADEIWITSSTWEIVPVVQLNDKPVGTGNTGAMWSKVNSLYQQFKEEI